MIAPSDHRRVGGQEEQAPYSAPGPTSNRDLKSTRREAGRSRARKVTTIEVGDRAPFSGNMLSTIASFRAGFSRDRKLGSGILEVRERVDDG